MKVHAPNPRRAELKALSATVRPLVKAGAYPSVNAAILELYSEETGASEWKTFHEWRAAGRPVKKGERGFPVWGIPRPLKKAEALETEESDAGDFFPVCYLFHAGQVESTELAAA